MNLKLRKKVLLFGLCSLFAAGNSYIVAANNTTLEITQQTKKITGKVVDQSGEAIIGANVLEKGTTNGTITDFDGNFTLNVNKNGTLVFSFIGYKTKEVKVSAQSNLKVVLADDNETLDEVVVVGYGTTKKALVTGANLNVKGDEIAKLNTGGAMEALQGIAPGVSITRNNGAPGSGTKVTIRGLGTVGSAGPLYIVDGVSVGNIDYLSPNDIESIDVLKDAASAAIYGSRAANGVILVTTKKGKFGSKTRVSYDGYYGIQNLYKKPALLNAQEYMYISDEGRVNDGLEPEDWHKALTNNAWLNNNFPGQLGTKYGEDIWNMLQNGWQGTNWIDEITKKDAPLQSHSLTITGGKEDVNYAIGASYYKQDGILGGDICDAGFRRFTARVNTEMILYKNSKFDVLKIGENLTYKNSKNKGIGTGNIYWNDMHNAICQYPLGLAYWNDSPDENHFGPNLDGIDPQYQHNTVAVMYYNRSKFSNNSSNNIVGNFYAELQPIQDLKFRTSFGLDANFGNSRSWTPLRKGLGSQFTPTTRDAVSQSMNQYYSYTWTNTLTYSKKFGEHSLQLLVGNEINQTKVNLSMSGSKTNSLFGDFEHAYLNNVPKPSNVADMDVSGVDWAAQGGGLVSYMGRLSYNYKSKYMFDATYRADGSSNFDKGHRWGYFPSFSAGWLFTEENFMKDMNFINYGKLRASWGQNGNQTLMNQSGNYVGFIYSSNINYMNPGYYFGSDKATSGVTAAPANVPNKDITWETSEQLNFGVDTKFLNSRLSFSFDWYKKTTKDWLVVAPILGTAGAGAPFVNGGDIENKGYEIVLGWNDKVSDFNYGATLSLSHNKNKVTRIASSDGIINGPTNVLNQGSSYISRVEVGQPIGFFYGYKTDGVLQNQADVDKYVGPDGKPYFEDQRPGDLKFVDQNNDGVIGDEDRVKLGDPHPKYEAGLQLNAEYKGFYVNTTLTGKFGMQVMNGYFWNDNVNQNYTTEVFGRWHGEGTSNKIPRLSSGSHRNSLFISDAFMYDADFVRISNLTVGYDFTKLVKNLHVFQGGKIYASVNNLCTITGYKGMDPDVAYGGDNCSWSSGIDLGLYPLARTVMFGVNLSF